MEERAALSLQRLQRRTTRVDVKAISEAPLRAAIITVTPFRQNCSLVWCSKTMRGALVDPGGDLDRIKTAVAKAGVTLEKILLTHGHADHCGQAGMLADELNLPVEGPHEADRPARRGRAALRRCNPMFRAYPLAW